MTPTQLAVLAQAPCSSTMVGFGPPLAAARVVAWAEAIWLKGMSRAAMATARAGMMRRSFACCTARATFTVISFAGMPSDRSVAWRGPQQAIPLLRLLGRQLAAGIGPVTALVSAALEFKVVRNPAS